MNGRKRTFSELDRRIPQYEPRETMLIVCEDAKIAPRYFRRLKKELDLTPVEVFVCGEECSSDPLAIVNFAQETRDSGIAVFDHIWCIIDIDQHASLEQAIDKARAEGINFALSNPCFEYWFLLHFKRCIKEYSRCRRVCKDIQAYVTDFAKGDCPFPILYPKTKTAIKNAKEIQQVHHQGETDLRGCNPSTDVWRVVELMQEIAAKPFPFER